MKKYAILLGSAPEDFRQKKIEEMFDFLDSKRSAGDSIVTFANGISELMLEMVMDNSVKQLAGGSHSELDSESMNKKTLKQVQGDERNSILLYICTLQPVGENEKTFWLGGEEIRRDVIWHYQKLATECGIDMQVVLDSDSDMVKEDDLGWEEVIDPVEITISQACRSEFISESTKEMLKQSADDNKCPRVQHDEDFQSSAESAGD